MFRGFPVKSEASFVKHNQKLFHQCGFRFSGRSSEHAEQKPRNLESGPQNLNFSLLVEKFDMFRGLSVKSETTFVNQLLILFHKCGLFTDNPRNIMEPPKTPASPLSKSLSFQKGSRAFLRILSTEGRGVGLCWALSNPLERT